MSRANLTPFLSGPSALSSAIPAPSEHRIIRSRLSRILAFTGLSIDDVVNSRIAKNHVRNYFRLSRSIERREEVAELERQWNPTGRSR